MSSKEFSIKGFLNFEYFITKPMMSAIYLIGVIIITLISIGLFIGGRSSPFSYINPSSGYLAAIVLFIVGNLVWRIVCEGITVIYSIYEKL
jgi:hypothetical protein